MDKKSIIEKYLPENCQLEAYGNIFSYEVPVSEIGHICHKLYFSHKLQLKIITALDERKEKGCFKIVYIFGVPKENVFLMPFVRVKDGEGFPSITDDIHQASGYERRIKTFFGVEPIGHPDASPILLHENWPADVFPLRKDFNWKDRPAEANTPYNFKKVEGEGIYEIPVGPVHAGIIEPGHFRFSVAGEEIILLEPKLGYKHKGTEKLFEILPLEEKLRLSERVSGDTSFTHSLAFCQAVETLAEIEVPERAKYLRVIYSELERLANHFNDVGFILSDTGFNFGGANGTRLREMIMQWNEKLTGSRFLRGVNVIGGVNKDLSLELAQELIKDLEKIKKDFAEVIEISEDSSSVFNRLQDTGTLDKQVAHDHGVIGVAGRAVGIEHDARKEYPYAGYDKIKFEMALEEAGDVRARFYIRVKEAFSSIAIITEALQNIPEGEIRSNQSVRLKKNNFALGITEGWRGDIVYLVATDGEGQISRVALRDPSFLNWTVLGYAGKGNVVLDFPLINKSFNLSYSGNDL